MEKVIFITPAAQSKWWHAIQRGEATSEYIASYFANNEPREVWRTLFRSYAVILKRLRVFHNNDCSDDRYKGLHDFIASMMLHDIRERYNEVTTQIVDRYLVLFNGKEVCNG